MQKQFALPCLLRSTCFEGRMWDLIVSVPDHCLFFTLDRDTHALIPQTIATYENAISFHNFENRLIIY